MRPGSVLTGAWMATATVPLNTATLLMEAPASTAVASSVPIFTGLAGLARLSTSTAPS